MMLLTPRSVSSKGGREREQKKEVKVMTWALLKEIRWPPMSQHKEATIHAVAWGQTTHNIN